MVGQSRAGTEEQRLNRRIGRVRTMGNKRRGQAKGSVDSLGAARTGAPRVRMGRAACEFLGGGAEFGPHWTSRRVSRKPLGTPWKNSRRSADG